MSELDNAGKLNVVPWLEAREYSAWDGAKQDRRERPSSADIPDRSGVFGAAAGLVNGHIAVVISGREGPPVDDYEPNSSLALFDLTTNRWIAHYDVDGYLSRRIGHSAVTVEDTTIVFGGELVDYVPDIALKSLNDTYRLSFREQVLRCEHICTNTSSEETDVLEQPPPRAWHASVSVKIPHATDTSEPLAATIGMLVLGGKGSSGNHLADVWLLTVAADKDQRWSQLSPTGTSPLPLSYHQAVAVGDGQRVIVLGGLQQQQGTNQATMNHDINVLDMVTDTWSTLRSPVDGIPDCLVARCFATAVVLKLPMDRDSRQLIRLVDSNAKCDPSEVVVVFGGYSDRELVLSSTRWLLVDPESGATDELDLTNAVVQSHLGHATVTSQDGKSLYLFGGMHSQTRQFLDTTIGFHFWDETPILQAEEEAIAKRQADANPIKTKSMANGDEYVGEMDPSQMNRHGKGKCTYRNGDVYDGEWRDNQKCGQGVMRYSGGDIYSGEWVNDQRHGYGILDYHVSDKQLSSRHPVKHEGLWANDKQYGSGCLTYSDGSKLIGTWGNGSLRSDMPNRLEGYDDGTHGACTYIGDTLDGVPHGKGESHHGSTKETYEGEWVNGKRCGRGKATQYDGTVYDGDWKNGKRNGFGRCDYARSRDIYDGKWVGDVRCGRGVCTFANGNRYDGEWKDDQCHGTGRYTFADGSFYDGEWRSNRFHGDGAFVLCMDDIHTQSTASLPS